MTEIKNCLNKLIVLIIKFFNSEKKFNNFKNLTI